MDFKKPISSFESFIESLGTAKVALSLFILTLSLRLLFLDFYPLNIDEPFTVFYSQMSFDQIGQMLRTENNPPLFFVIMHFWINVFGISEFSVRFLPALYSALTVIFIYLIGKDNFSKRVGLTSSFIFIFSESHFEYSHDCRAYTLLVFLSTVSIYYLLKLLSENGKRTDWLWFGVCNSFLAYAHFIGWLVLFIEVVFILSEFKKAPIKKFVISYAVTLITLAPYLPIFLKRVTESTKNETWVQKPYLSDLYSKLWDFSNKPLVTIVFIIILLSGFIFLIRQKNKTNMQLKALLFWFLIPYIGLFIVSNKLPLYIERYLLIISIPYYILIAAFVDLFISNHKKLRAFFLFLPLLMLFTTNLNPSRRRPNKQIVELLMSLKTKSNALLINPDWYEPTFLYYYNTDVFRDYGNSRKYLNENNIYPIDTYEKLGSLPLFTECNRIIYFQSNPSIADPQNVILNYLKSNFNYVSTINAYKCRISVFNKK